MHIVLIALSVSEIVHDGVIRPRAYWYRLRLSLMGLRSRLILICLVTSIGVWLGLYQRKRVTATGDQADDLFWATLRIIDRSKRLKILAICRLKRKIENSTHFGILAFFNHSALWSCTGKFSLFREIGPQWPKLEPFPPLGPDFGMVLGPTLFEWLSLLDLFLHPSPPSKHFLLSYFSYG